MANEHLTATLIALKRYALERSNQLEETRRQMSAVAKCHARMRKWMSDDHARAAAPEAEPSFVRLTIRCMNPFRPCDLEQAGVRFVMTMLLIPIAALLANLLAKLLS